MEIVKSARSGPDDVAALERKTGESFSPQLRHRDSLNLGCGRKHLPHSVNLDVTPETNPDVLHDLNTLPWPLPDNHFSEVLAYDVIEHLDNFMGAMEEIHRVCRDKAKVKIAVPHFSSAEAYTDPTHRRCFGYFSFDYVTGEHGARAIVRLPDGRLKEVPLDKIRS